MQKRFVSIWFRNLKTDWFIRRQPGLNEVPFVLVSPDHGRMIVTASNILAQKKGVEINMALADARAIIPSLQFFDDEPERSLKLLKALSEWFIRYTPAVALDLPDGLMLDVTGCAHLWGGERQYLMDIFNRLKNFGYNIRIASADTIGTAWAIARFGQSEFIIETGQQTAALLPLPPSALRLETETIERLEKLGLRQINNFINMPRSALHRRFGQYLLKRLDQALGYEEETIQPVHLIEPYHERLPCMEPIVTATGIEIALQRLLDILCYRLQQEEKGLRVALFKSYRVDGKIEKIEIGTHRPSCNSKHLFKLFEIKISGIEPALGIELFILEAVKVEELSAVQEKLWNDNGALNDTGLFELLDRIAGKLGANHIRCYIPDEHYWPERSFKPSFSINEKLETLWKVDRPRPLQMLPKPEPIEVTAPIPDYPPMLFRYKGKLHKITKADGPERIEPEWWLQEEQHRDYYYVEDEEGHRYWLFRSGHYDIDRSYRWFIHGFFA
ncbi:MAG: DNA polymerase Y family protein [Ginsengibacter sp.]